MIGTALLLEDDATFGQLLSKALTQKGLLTEHYLTIKSFQQALNEKKVDLILMDLRIGETHALNLISAVRSTQPEAKIFIITGFASIATTVQAIKNGADDYLPKPVTASEILHRYLKTDHLAEVPTTALSVERIEWEHIQSVLHNNQGNISETARELNMHRRTLQRKLQKHPPKL